MKKYLFIVFAFLLSCTELIDAPKNLIEKDKMSEVVAEFAMNDQIYIFVPGTDMANATRFALMKNNIKPEDFVESYKYYTATRDLENILNNAQKIILEKDPAARDYIEKKLKENNKIPPIVK